MLNSSSDLLSSEINCQIPSVVALGCSASSFALCSAARAAALSSFAFRSLAYSKPAALRLNSAAAVLSVAEAAAKSQLRLASANRLAFS